MPTKMNRYINNLSLVAVLILLVPNNINAQNPSEPFIFSEKENPIFWFNPKLYKNVTLKYFNEKRFTFDTTNYCRTKMSKIKSLSIYELNPNISDSILTAKVDYSINGLTKYWETNTDLDVKSINCNAISLKKLRRNAKIVIKDSDTKYIYRTDSIGRITFFCAYI